MYSLLVFDWDGTLMDSEAHIVACMHVAMRSMNLDPLPAAHVRGIIGLGMREAICSLYPGADGDFMVQFAKAYRESFMEGAREEQRLFPDVPEILEELEATGYLLAVATGKGRAGLNSILRQTGLVDRFHATRCADESFSKPHPGMLEELMSVCGVARSQTLMIGDTTFDLEMARNAGTDAVGVSYGVHTEENLRALNPLTILHRINELPNWLSSSETRVSYSDDSPVNA